MAISVKIADGRRKFWQWDTEMYLVTEDLPVGAEIHYDMPDVDIPYKTLIEDRNGECVSRVPDELLQHPGKFVIWVYVSDEEDGNRTVYSKKFNVEEREKPPDYVYTETEQSNFNTLDARLTEFINSVRQLPEGGQVGQIVVMSDGGVIWQDIPKSGIRSVNGVGPDENGNVEVRVGVNPDWEQNDETAADHVKNRTHNEKVLFDITWDGNMDGLSAIDLSALGYEEGMYIVKISDSVYSLEELIGSTYHLSSYENETLIGYDNINTWSAPGMYSLNDMIIVIYSQESVNSIAGLPDGTITNGVYFFAYPEYGIYIDKFTKTEIKKLDMKFLPDSIPYEKPPLFDITWDGNMDGSFSFDMTPMGYEGLYYVKVSDEVFAIDDLIGSEIRTTNNGLWEDLSRSYFDTETYPGVISISNFILAVYDQTLINPALGLPDDTITNGVYFYARPEEYSFVTRFTGRREVVQMDEKYLPDSINYNKLYNTPAIYTDVIRYDVNQSLSYSRMSRARSNIDVYSKSEVDSKIGTGDMTNYVTKSEMQTAIDSAIGDAIGGGY